MFLASVAWAALQALLETCTVEVSDIQASKSSSSSHHATRNDALCDAYPLSTLTASPLAPSVYLSGIPKLQQNAGFACQSRANQTDKYPSVALLAARKQKQEIMKNAKACSKTCFSFSLFFASEVLLIILHRTRLYVY